ncbi:RES family NAD+ phosphorylase [Mycobacterium sp.]|uniref:RES family NAD+ phosphorylase n=1 Tax=Mycobacterium sp. TaxID=1785 RepID=UPI002B88C5CA|nr:RES family NAD+ phosphorylase [Mycobacterium sp.]HTY32706.1 RES family NAD+ phosphorylase [Mycobacterium sp.]
MSRPKPKVPRTPPDRLTKESADVVDYTGVLWRIHRTNGDRVRPWNELRTYGPLATMRWDPHPGLQPASHRDSVLYAATDLATGLAEVYQTTRLIDTHAGAPRLTAWEPTRPLQLLDVSGTWLLRNTASAALLAAPRAICRRWARAIYTTWPELDGLQAPSTMTGRVNVVLWSAAADSIPATPSFSRPLTQPMVWSLAQAAATGIGYGII